MMRPLLLLALLILPAAADDDARLERLHMARLAFEARVKLADMLREDGKRKEALEAYGRAVAIFEAALDATTEQQEVVLKGVIGIGGGAGGAFRRRPGKPADNAVERGLKWLAAHQDDKGCWDADEFMKHDPENDQCDGKGAAHADVAVTGLAALAFVGGGYTDRGSVQQNPYAKTVREALRFLLTSQAADGSFVPAETPQALYANAVATLALCEAYWMTKNPRHKKPAQDGVAFLLKQQTAGAAWKEAGCRDASITAWCVSAVASARNAGLEVPERALADALTWVDSVTNKETGRVGEEAKTEWATAACLFTRSLCGQGPRATGTIPKGARLLSADPPRWNAEDGVVDMDYWRFGTLALFQIGGGEWTVWSKAMKAAMVDRQQAAGSRAGSWDPVGVAGGRVEATALMTMNLEAYYRYARFMGGR